MLLDQAEKKELLRTFFTYTIDISSKKVRKAKYKRCIINNNKKKSKVQNIRYKM